MTREDLLLTTLAEECAEVAKNVSKALRFGLEDSEPGAFESNRHRIEDELRDLNEVAKMLEADGTLGPGWREPKPEKAAKVEHFLKYSARCGRLEEPGRMVALPVRTLGDVGIEAQATAALERAGFGRKCCESPAFGDGDTHCANCGEEG